MSEFRNELQPVNDAPASNPQLAWRPSFNELQSFNSVTRGKNLSANQSLINRGIFNDIQIDFSDAPLLAQEMHYQSYESLNPQEPVHDSLKAAPYNSSDKVITGASNFPSTTQACKTIGDVDKLVGGIANKASSMVGEVTNFLSQPESINKSIIQLGPILDTAVNYYANNNLKTFSHDAGVFSQAGLKEVDNSIDRLSLPMDQKNIGNESAALATFFLLGSKLALSEAKVQEMGLRSMSDLELKTIGIERRLEAAERGFPINGATRSFPLGFNDEAQFLQAARELKEAALASGFDDCVIGVRGSSVTGTSPFKGTPFHAASDIDFFIESDKLATGRESKRISGMISPRQINQSHPLLEAWSLKWTNMLERKVSPAAFRANQVPSEPAIIVK